LALRDLGPVAHGLRGLGAGRAGGLGATVRRRAERRERERVRTRCLDELGELIDVVALCMSSGVSFDAALETYCTRYRTDLSALLAEAMAAWRMGLATRKEALDDVARELQIPAFTMFVETVTESLEFGAPMAQALAAQAGAVREARRMDVEERIQKAPVKMLIPTSVLILPALILAILGPMLAPLAQIGA
jgi:tight adherence protein C